MNFNLAPAEYQQIPAIQKPKKENKNKTLKQRKKNSKKVNELIRNITKEEEEDSSDDETMGDFVPKPKMTTVGDKKKHEEKLRETLRQKEKEFDMPIPSEDGESDDESVTRESFKNIVKQSPLEQYYDQKQMYPQYYSSPEQKKETNELLVDKLNYMIHLLEEKKEEKNGTLHEELILYGFLGVFMIFLVDSFARVGKYYKR